jgi:translation initiation factor 2 beta subunit (eIF-2beta)/eIF-5
MSTVNICGYEPIDDPFYRYTMDKIVVVKEKHKTAITNIDKVAKDLDRDELMIVYFFKKEFGCNFIFKHGKLTTTTALTENQVSDALKHFIEYLVICPICRLPETEIMIFKKSKSKKNTNDYIVMDCKSCSFNGPINTTKIKNKAVII